MSRLRYQKSKSNRFIDIKFKTTSVYRCQQDVLLAMDTYYVESYNNVLNVSKNKGIALRNDKYRKRSKFAILHWNGNVSQAFTNECVPHTTLVSSRQPQGKIKYKKQSFGKTGKNLGKVNR